MMGLLIRYGLSTDDWYLETTGINEWKHTVKYAVRNYAFRLLKSQCKENKSLGGFHLARQNLMGPTGLGLMRVVIIRQWLATKAILS